ncbi:MAG: PAS domain-containing protein [Deltaproteobacteria bacterium]|jgi:PAS domain S-box-containing protein|nr:PAS domain-containing protein [Deltaproteobacteria bacterium]
MSVSKKQLGDIEIKPLCPEKTGHLLRKIHQQQIGHAPQDQQSSGKKSNLHGSSGPGRTNTAIPETPTDAALLRCVIDTIGDLIYVKNTDGVYLKCNKASEQFIGKKESEQVGKTDFDFFDHALARQIQNADRQILSSGEEFHAEETLQKADGQTCILETKKAPFYQPDGSPAGIVGISRDITRRKEAEDRLKKANRELDSFVYTVSHDLRTPLTQVFGYAEILMEGYSELLDERALYFLSQIISSAEKMRTLITDLLYLATIGQTQSSPEDIDLAGLVKSIANNLSKELSEAQMSVQAKDLPKVKLPKTLLFQIFDNLISNALKYGSKPGSVIEIGGTKQGRLVQLWVRVSGPGIPVEEREQIFDVFWRGSTSRGKTGTGIGLATIQKIASLFNGRSWVEETPGGGSTFCVEFFEPLDQS